MRLNQPYPWSLMLLMLAVLLGCLTLAAWGQVPSPTPGKSLPVILEFGRKLWPICKGMEQVLQEIKQEFGRQLVIRLVYIDQEENLFHRYKIFFVPTQVFLDASGKEVFRHEGPLLKEKLVQKLRELNFIHDWPGEL